MIVVQRKEKKNVPTFRIDILEFSLNGTNIPKKLSESKVLSGRAYPDRASVLAAIENGSVTIIDQYTTNQITYRHWSLKLDWNRCGHFVVGILPQHSKHISTGFFVQSTCLLEFYSRNSIICTQIMLRIKEKNKKISFKLIGIALS